MSDAGTTVLIVDDEEYALSICVDSVKWDDYGIQVLTAKSGEEAYKIIESKKNINILITDIKMTGMDGLELIRKANELNLGISCLVMSSYNDFDLVRQAMKLGARDYLFKPTMMPEDIINVVLETISKKNVSSEADVEASLQLEINDPKINKVISYIDENFTDFSLSLGSAAEYVGVSRGYLSKRFKEVTRYKFVDYITKKRLEKAKELCINTDMKIYEISEYLGYSDWHYLYSLYKKEYGHSMTAERKSRFDNS